MSLVLYRKYRPQTFAEIIGQEHIVQTLTNAICAGMISHAYLFSGPRGSGKTSIARLLAKAVNCQSRKEGEFEPCNQCSSCQEINDGKALDLIEIDAASHRGIDEIRELKDGIRFGPTKSKYKVFVIDECLTADHLISMADGTVKEISKIVNGDKILSIDIDTGEIVEKFVFNWFKRKTNRLIEIKTPQTLLKVTPAHRLWIVRDSKFLLIEAKDLKIGDFLLSPVYLPHVQRNNLTPKQLSFLALIQCDGYIFKDSITVQIEIRKDKDYFKKIVKEGLKAWQIKEKPVIKTISRGTRLIRIYSRKLKEILINLSCPEGKKGKKIDIPKVIFQAPLESIKAYIDTCFCCQGNIDFSNSLNLYRLNFNSTSEIFVKKLQLLLKKFGISSSFLKIPRKKRNKKHSTQYRLSLSHYNLKIFHQRVGLSLKRKAKILAKCSSEKEKPDRHSLRSCAISFRAALSPKGLGRIGIFAYLVQPFRPKVKGLSEFQFIERPIRPDTIPIEKIIIEKQKEKKVPYSKLVSLGIWPDLRQHLSTKAVVNYMKVGGLPELNKYLQFQYEKVKKIRILNKKEEVYDFTVEDTHTFIANGICSSNCHQLTKEAANALLKTLEEPPGHAIFVLATTEVHKMIPTIVSRCQRFDFRKLTLPEIIKRLEFITEKEGVKIQKPALELIALNSSGSLRDAESLLDQALTFASAFNRELRSEDIKDLLGLVEIELVSKFIDFLTQKKSIEAINFLNEIIEKGLDLQEFSKSLINYLRQALILRLIGETTSKPDNPIITGLTKEEFSKLQSQAFIFKERELQKIINLFLEAQNKMKYSPIPQLPLELAIIEWASEV